MTASATVGLFVSSHNTGELGTATFDNVTVTPGGGPLPSPWASTDVGSPAVPGKSTYANGVYTVNGSGSDIWGTADQFQYAYQPLTGDGTIVAQVTSQAATDPWAKAGIMIKQSATAGAPYAMVAVTPGNGINMEYSFDANIAGGSYSFPNAWLMLSRTGNVFTAYDSPNGTTWTEVGSTTITMTASATVGLFVSSHNTSELGTATFQNVTVTAAAGDRCRHPGHRPTWAARRCRASPPTPTGCTPSTGPDPTSGGLPTSSNTPTSPSTATGPSWPRSPPRPPPTPGPRPGS